MSREQLKDVLGGWRADTSSACPTGQAKYKIGTDDLGYQTLYMCCILGLEPEQQAIFNHLVS